MNIIQHLKENGDDFEWYPTTMETVERLAKELRSRYNPPRNILDIGCGRVTRKINDRRVTL